MQEASAVLATLRGNVSTYQVQLSGCRSSQAGETQAQLADGSLTYVVADEGDYRTSAVTVVKYSDGLTGRESSSGLMSTLLQQGDHEVLLQRPGAYNAQDATATRQTHVLPVTGKVPDSALQTPVMLPRWSPPLAQPPATCSGPLQQQSQTPMIYPVTCQTIAACTQQTHAGSMRSPQVTSGFPAPQTHAGSVWFAPAVASFTAPPVQWGNMWSVSAAPSVSALPAHAGSMPIGVTTTPAAPPMTNAGSIPSVAAGPSAVAPHASAGSTPYVGVSPFVSQMFGGYSCAPSMPAPTQWPPATMCPEVPPLQMPHFDGKRAEFRSFWQLFEEAVHAQPGLSNAYKMMYLQSLLKREPEELVRAYGADGAYYEAAVASLKKKYGDQARLLNELHAEFDSIHAASDSLASARITLTRVDVVCRRMEAAGQSPENAHVAFKIERLMPEWVLEAVLQEKMNSALWTVKMLLDAIARTIGLREAAASLSGGHQQLTSRKESEDESSDDERESSPRNKSSWTSRIDDETAQKAQNVVWRKHPCKLCDGNHIESDCTAYPSVQERKERIKQQNRCLRCLREGHRAAHCRSTGRCFFCYAKHHSSLCEKHISDIADQEGSGSEPDDQSQEDEDAEAEDDFEEDVDRESEDEDTESQADEVTREVRMYVTLTSAAAEVAESVSRKSNLLTRKVVARNPLGSENAGEDTVILCDGGADASFVSMQLVEKLQLLPVNSENLVIKTMTGTARIPDCKVYDVDIRRSDDSYMRVRAYECSRPIGALRSLHVEQAGDEAQGCEWSVAEETTYPEVIVGADYVYQLDIRQVANRASNCILLHSKVGPMAVQVGGRIPYVFNAGSGEKTCESTMHCEVNRSHDAVEVFKDLKQRASSNVSDAQLTGKGNCVPEVPARTRQEEVCTKPTEDKLYETSGRRCMKPVFAHDDVWQQHRFLTHAVQVKSARQSRVVRVNAVFNSEVKRSFISKSLVKALHLERAGARQVEWISREGESYSTYAEFYRISVMGEYGELIDVEVYEKCSLGSPVPTMEYEPVEPGNVHRGCHAVEKNVTAMMLIGADNYGVFCVSRIADLGKNVTLYQSLIGYMCTTVRREAAESMLHRDPLEARRQEASAKRGRYNVQVSWQEATADVHRDSASDETKLSPGETYDENGPGPAKYMREGPSRASTQRCVDRQH